MKWKQDEYHGFKDATWCRDFTVKILFLLQQQVWCVIEAQNQSKWCVCWRLCFFFFNFPIPLIIPAPPLKDQTLPPFRLLFPRWSLWYPDFFKLSCRRTRQDWDQQAVVVVVAQRSGTQQQQQQQQIGRDHKGGSKDKKKKKEKKRRILIPHTTEARERWIPSSCCRSLQRWSPESHLGWNLLCTVGSCCSPCF